ncbi:MAG: protein-export chaperone SecB [Pseudomonadota bacterium]|nr:protein-export chaperone SecB [Gammaproteobacteria bacterium]MEC8009828.1 protein-export chaperone SecB [Pseudomonadota bacterium]HBF09496.1 protein-export chaperone SecB [Gammaproteobacteria bacterium]|tara:strand:- start:289 stop:756 length:468 start_codon:yes stop_codon:yes gene_type:complete
MAEATAQNQQFALQRIYIKDLSFESPNAPKIFSQEWKPKMNLDLNNKTTKVSDNTYEVVLAITISVTNGEAAEQAFIVEVQQAGLFHAEGFDEASLQQLLGSYCPNILFPYAREAVSDVVGKGSFPQLLMAPVNFDALFAEAQKRQQAQGTAPVA